MSLHMGRHNCGALPASLSLNESRMELAMMFRTILGATLAFAAMPVAPVMAQARLVLDQHKAVYELQLDETMPAKGIEGARGRIAFDFTGDACEGYALSFRQVTQLQSAESGLRTIDSRQTNFEDGAGTQFRYKSENAVGGVTAEQVDGVAQKTGDTYTVKVTKPKLAQSTFGADVLFPSGQVKAILTAAREGKSTFEVKLFDGSDDGRQVYDTLAVIGRKAVNIPVDKLEEPLRRAEFKDMPFWPVTISYFKRSAGETVPSYRVAFDLYENGVTGAVRMHYTDFSLKATLTRLDLLPRSACAK